MSGSTGNSLETCREQDYLWLALRVGLCMGGGRVSVCARESVYTYVREERIVESGWL